MRFANAPPARAVNDRANVAAQPVPRAFVRWLYNYDGQFQRRITRALELHRPERARGINALDEVPNSTWFTNRIGVRDVSPEEIATAPGGVGSPEAFKPWTIVSTKVGGMSVGFIIKDTRGEKFLLKFDPRGLPEAETATQVIVGKLLWAFGYNVTEDYVLYVHKQDLVLAPDAVVKDIFGHKSPLGQRELDKRLALIETAADGRIRVLVSHWLPGKPLGGHAAEGVRGDDPNDRIPHELRRDLRGAYAVFSWLDHFDIHEGNMLDVWVGDPADPKRHYVKHYWVDYGVALGFSAKKNVDARYGYEFYWDPAAMARSLLSFGALERPWEQRKWRDVRGLGLYETDLYDPGAWVSSSAAYVPIYVADRIDKFWASKILIRFTRDQIKAAVDSAQLSDPKAAAWLVDALIARQRATARYWFERVNPLDEPAIADDTLCFKDLAIAHAFAPAGNTHYAITTYDHAGTQLAATDAPAGDSGVTCTRLGLAADRNGYTIVRVDTTRPQFTGTTYFHLARDPTTQAARVIGVWRP
ncbi:MAG TPA: hypothetical protein VFV99_21235 [Kofleriaceae bacterium]|nr:hypothetical protein [Kofleriaceae bacterium]